MSTRREIEIALEDKIVKGEAPTGVYDTGLVYVIATLGGVDGDEVMFEWQDCVHDIRDCLLESDVNRFTL